jgi:hypothetical protein
MGNVTEAAANPSDSARIEDSFSDHGRLLSKGNSDFSARLSGKKSPVDHVLLCNQRYVLGIRCKTTFNASIFAITGTIQNDPGSHDPTDDLPDLDASIFAITKASILTEVRE